MIAFYRKFESYLVFSADQRLCQRLLAAAPLPMSLTKSQSMFLKIFMDSFSDDSDRDVYESLFVEGDNVCIR